MTRKRNWILASILLIVMTLFISFCQEQGLIRKQDGTGAIIFSVDSLLKISAASIDTVTVRFDHSRKQTCQYLAYPFTPILEHLKSELHLDSSASITFVCHDGYQVSNTLAELNGAGQSFIAFSDLPGEPSNQWSPARSHYAPYYLVWDSLPYSVHGIAWPYGWTEIHIQNDDPFQSIEPVSSKLREGFQLYKTHCIKCHSLNGLGGDLGPEFNVPMNVTEYWERDMIIQYARDPNSVRKHSKMYAMDWLSENELDQVVDYLAFMAHHKVEE